MSDDIKKGLLGIVVDETEVSKVMPEINSLTYRGYAAQDLCAKCKFEEVAYLILNGELPTKKQLKKFEKEERKERKLSKTLLDDIKKFPKKAREFPKFFKFGDGRDSRRAEDPQKLWKFGNPKTFLETFGNFGNPRVFCVYHLFQLEIGPGNPNQAENDDEIRGAEAPATLSSFSA